MSKSKISRNLFILSLSLVFLVFLGVYGASALELTNPLSGGATPIGASKLFGRIIKGALGIVGAVALAIFVWGGFLWLTSGGSPEKIKKGRDALVWAIIGLVIIFGSYLILNYIIIAITEGTQ